MYTFSVKENGSGIEIIITRSMLALAALAVMLYHGDELGFTGLVASLTLFIIAGAVKILMVKFRINKLLILFGASLILFAATRSFSLALILLLFGYLSKFLNKKPIIGFTGEGINIKKLFGNPVYGWGEFSNVILKDGLLTLDFKNNKLLQLELEEDTAGFDENGFNNFCKRYICATDAVVGS